MIPYLSLAFGAGAFYQKVSQLFLEVEKLLKKTEKFEQAILEINARREERRGKYKRR